MKETPWHHEGVPQEDLPQLAGEIRETIVDTVCNKTGGHFASNLGVVELTIALHRVFDFPRDRLLLDVGHQSYPHKLLTGRRHEFDTLRQRDGLSGFANKFESEYDPFLWGHAGTSISCATGLTWGDHLLGVDDRQTIAVIGDSSIGAGMAFEALNHAGASDQNVLVILNDNRMSIHNTTGALTKYFQRIRAGHFYQEVDKDVHALLQNLPLIGGTVDRAYERLKDVVKAGMLPGQFFQHLGF